MSRGLRKSVLIVVPLLLVGAVTVLWGTTATPAAPPGSHHHGGKKHKKADPYRLVWNKVPLKYGKTGETRTITVENLGVEGKVTSLSVVSTPATGITIPEAEVEACRKKTYEVAFPGNQCEMTATYSEASPRCAAPYKLEVLVLPGQPGEEKVILRG